MTSHGTTGASELNDLTPTDFPDIPLPLANSTSCPSPATVNQSTAAVLDQSTAAVLDGKLQYAALVTARWCWE